MSLRYLFMSTFQPYFMRGRNKCCLHPKVIPITSLWVKLHKNLLRYVLEIYFPSFFNKTRNMNKLCGLPTTSLWNPQSILRSNNRKMKNLVTLSKVDLSAHDFTRKYILKIKLSEIKYWIFSSWSEHFFTLYVFTGT